ncbi:MAG: signal peptidase I, partial [Phycisphaerales bacterium]|nr:signal peptidase I [Phycisphaerales bacterium]
MSTSEVKSWQHTRNNIEGIGIAIILAFVLRAFLIEAFVIPTGSMATGLYGEHYELTCACCGHQWAHGLQHRSGGVNPGSPAAGTAFNPKGDVPSGALCPNCNYDYSANFGVLPKPLGRKISGGDRVLVMKYLYDIRPPKPWDVVVFKNPQTNRQNYIKRLIGLPGETIQIVHGDIFVKTAPDNEFQIRRKPRHAQDVLWHIFYDNDHCPDPQLLRESSTEAPEWACTQGHVERTMEGRVLTAVRTPATLDFRPGKIHPDRTGWLPHNGYNLRGNNLSKHDHCSDLQLKLTLKAFERGAIKANATFGIRGHQFRVRYEQSTLTLERASRTEANAKWITLGQASFERGHSETTSLVIEHVDWQFRVRDEPTGTTLSTTDSNYPCDFAIARDWATRPMRLDAQEDDIDMQLGDLVLRSPTPDINDQIQRLEASLQEIHAKRELLLPSVQIRLGADNELWHVKLSRDVFYTSPHIPPNWNSVGEQYAYARQLLRDYTNPACPNRWTPVSLDAVPSSHFRAWGTFGNPIALRAF